MKKKNTEMRNTKRCSKRIRNNGGVILEKQCCWSDLPSDVLETITSKLFFADQINFRAVCKSWNSIDRGRVSSPLKQMPWLMVFDDKKGKHSWNSCKLVDPTYKKTYKIDMSFINKKKSLKDCRVRIHESKYGWLLMSCVSVQTCRQGDNSLFLYSPFITDNNIIELPVFNAHGLPVFSAHRPPILSAHDYYIATFDLILNPSKKKKKKKKEECFEVLVLSSKKNGTICIRTCRQGDSLWSCNKTIWNFQLTMIKCLVYSEGIFHYTTRLGEKSGSYDIARNNWTQFPTLAPVLRLLTHFELKMIKFNGEIYLISMNKNSQSRGPMWVYIYKLDLSKRIWESMHNLDDRVLFVGDGYSSILELDNDVEELKDQRQKVYYCYTVLLKGWYNATMLKYCNVLHGNKSYVCSKWYGSLAQENQDCRRLWIDHPRRIRNSL